MGVFSVPAHADPLARWGLRPINVNGGCFLEGDSRVAETITESPGSGGVGLYGGGTQFDFHWFPVTNMLLGGRLHLVKNGAVGGSELSVILTRLQTVGGRPQDFDAQIGFFLGGINSINPSLSSNTVAGMLADYDAICAIYSANLPISFFQPDWPIEAAWSGYDRQHIIRYMNTRYREIVAKYPNLVWVDTYTPMVDPASADGAILTGLTRTDHIHPTHVMALGYSGPALANAISQRCTISEYLTAGWTNLIPAWGSGTAGTKNGFGGAGLTTAVTGDNPYTGFDVSVTAGPGSAAGVSVVLTRRSDVTNRLRIEIDNTSATDIDVEVRPTASVHGSVVTNDKVFVIAEMGVQRQVNVKGADAQIQRAGPSTNPLGCLFPTPANHSQKAWHGRPRSRPYTIASAHTLLKGAVKVTVGATTGTMSLEVSDLSLNKQL